NHSLAQRHEVPRFVHQYFLTRSESIHNACFPGAGAGRPEHYDGTRRLKNGPTTLQLLFPKPSKLGTTMVNGGSAQSAQNAIRNVGRPRDLKEMKIGRASCRDRVRVEGER